MSQEVLHLVYLLKTNKNVFVELKHLSDTIKRASRIGLRFCGGAFGYNEQGLVNGQYLYID